MKFIQSKVIGWNHLKNALKMLIQISFGVVYLVNWVIWDRRIRSVTWWQDFPEKGILCFKEFPLQCYTHEFFEIELQFKQMGADVTKGSNKKMLPEAKKCIWKEEV